MYTLERPDLEVVDLATWNVQLGGYAKRDVLPTDTPEREAVIANAVDHLHEQGVSAFTFIDAYLWDKRYKNEEGIAEHLGYASAFYMDLGDESLIKRPDVMATIGTVFATDHPVAQRSELDLGTRRALSVVLDIGKQGLRVVSVYLDDLNNARRFSQAKALVKELEREDKDVPTIIEGDINDLRNTMRGAGLRTRLGDMAVRTLAPLRPLMPISSLAADTVYEMNRGRKVIPYLEGQGFKDADPQKRPTVPARMPFLGLDYILHNEGVEVGDFEVVDTGGASDHLLARARAKVA